MATAVITAHACEITAHGFSYMPFDPPIRRVEIDATKVAPIAAAVDEMRAALDAAPQGAAVISVYVHGRKPRGFDAWYRAESPILHDSGAAVGERAA
jgi:hypothetical protein